jgi:predicted XRE-type DNA-binding protein
MSNNVFSDMGLPNPDERLLKAHIVLHLRAIAKQTGMSQTEIAKQTGMSQTEIAKQTGMTQPEVSNMLRGICKDISVERLLHATNALHHNVRIIIESVPTEVAVTTVELAAA